MQPDSVYTKAKANISQETMQLMKDQIAFEESCTLTGYLRKNPGPRILHEWARRILHSSYSSTKMLRGGYFEVEFTSRQG